MSIPENRFSQFINLERKTTHNTTSDCYTPRPMAKQIPTGTRLVGGEQLHNLLANILNSTQHFARHIGPTMLHALIQMATTRTRIINTYVIVLCWILVIRIIYCDSNLYIN